MRPQSDDDHRCTGVFFVLRTQNLRAGPLGAAPKIQIPQERSGNSRALLQGRRRRAARRALGKLAPGAGSRSASARPHRARTTAASAAVARREARRTPRGSAPTAAAHAADSQPVGGAAVRRSRTMTRTPATRGALGGEELERQMAGSAGADADGGDAPTPAEAARAPPRAPRAQRSSTPPPVDDDADVPTTRTPRTTTATAGTARTTASTAGASIRTLPSTRRRRRTTFSMRRTSCRCLRRARRRPRVCSPSRGWRSSPPAFPGMSAADDAGRSSARSRRAGVGIRPPPGAEASSGDGATARVDNAARAYIPQLGVVGPNSARARGPKLAPHGRRPRHQPHGGAWAPAAPPTPERRRRRRRRRSRSKRGGGGGAPGGGGARGD